MALPQNPNFLLTTRQASEFFGGSPSTATLHIWRGQRKGPPYCKLGGRVFYRAVDLEAWIGNCAIDFRNPSRR